MRIVRIILITLSIPLAICLLAVLLLQSPKSPYLQFIERDQAYFSQVAEACDVLLRQHPLGTNEFIRIEGGDLTIPRLIRDLHPSAIIITSNCVHVRVGVRDFGMNWEAQDGQTNSWALSIYAEGLGRTLYVEQER
jgi:hypothetical protein